MGTPFLSGPASTAAASPATVMPAGARLAAAAPAPPRTGGGGTKTCRLGRAGAVGPRALACGEKVPPSPDASATAAAPTPAAGQEVPHPVPPPAPILGATSRTQSKLASH